MYRTLFWRTSRRGTTVWMFDWLRPFLAASIIAPGMGGAIVWLALSPWWWCGLLTALLFPLARLRVGAEAPDTVRAIMLWPLIPYRRRRLSLAQLHSCYEDDLLSPLHAPHDAIAANDWVLPCRDAAAIVARLKSAGASMALPNAVVR